MIKTSFTSGIILSGGKSERMNYPKAMMSWDEDILINYQINSLIEAGCDEVIVVTGKDHQIIKKNIIKNDQVKLIYNPSYETGKTTSIKSGLRIISEQTEIILIIAVDQPRPKSIIEKIITFHKKNKSDITYPIYKKRGGHPLIFSKKMLPELLNISEEKKGIREIFKSNKFIHAKIDLSNIIVRIDINTIEDYKKAVKIFSKI